jgi:hypothetical protein
MTNKRFPMYKKIVALATCVALAGCWETGRGEKIGVLVKLSQEGAVCKTWEGEIVRGGFTNGTGANGAPFYFTIEDEAMAKQLQDVLDKGDEIKIHYRQEMNSFCRSDSRSTFLTGFEIVKPAQAQVPSTTATTPGEAVDRLQQIQNLLQVQAQLISELAASK